MSPLEDYCVQHSTAPSAVAKDLEKYTRAAIPGSNMLIGEIEASFLTFLIHSTRAKNVLELGTFTGYSALCMAEQLPVDGKVTTIDINLGTTTIAQEYWNKSPHGKKIHAVLQPGTDYLPGVHEKFDLIFIDADKTNYPFYVSWAKDHLSETGIIVIDNVLWSGKVIEPNPDPHTKAIQEASQLAASWRGFVTTMLPVRDGIMLAKKIAN